MSEPLPPLTLSISIVTYNPHISILKKTMDSLIASLNSAYQLGQIKKSLLYLILNGSETSQELTDQLQLNPTPTWLQIQFVKPEKNLGYGGGHNLVLNKEMGDGHLVLNPDVILHESAISLSLNHLVENSQTVMITPNARNEYNEKQYLCKQYPSLFVLFLRGFAPRFIKNLFRTLLAKYELRGFTEEAENRSIQIASGCYMFLRTRAYQEAEGFDDRFFLYMEDFDLSLRLAKIGEIVYLPQVKIIHYGGQASRKGWLHIKLFVLSTFKFFNKYKWKWI